jgi:ATP-binding cassette subfamily C protein
MVAGHVLRTTLRRQWRLVTAAGLLAAGHQAGEAQVKLIAGIHGPQRGAALLGGADLAALGTAGTAATVALVSQETHVFAGPLADDLRLGAGAWARALPDGLATVVGHGGHRLTAAQAQQVALARLLLADRPIVILDEATADAGSADARALEQAVRDALRGRTVLVVAHRLTQAAAADRIVVLDAGPRSAGTGDGG